jgi:HAD superfamily hydrolase (TIGR01549 family)
MALDAIIFDIDGTLIDSNALHIEAFRRAFANHGYTIAPDRIAVEIGKGGDNLVPDILGCSADAIEGDAIRDDQPKEFEKLAGKDGLKPFPKAAELIAEAKRRGLLTVIATSSGKKQLRVLQKYSGLDLEHAVDLLVTADEAKNSKPAPDLIASAVKKTGMSAAQCVMIGDTVYDATSARHAGVISLGVRCGGNTDDALLSAGMRKIFQDPADLLQQLDNALHIASPGELHLTTGIIQRLMRAALAAAEEGLSNGEAPIGSVLARGDGTLIAKGWNQQNQSQSKTAHAEMVASPPPLERCRLMQRISSWFPRWNLA